MESYAIVPFYDVIFLNFCWRRFGVNLKNMQTRGVRSSRCISLQVNVLNITFVKWVLAKGIFMGR